MTFRQGICEPPRFGVNDCWTTSSWRILQLSLWNLLWPLVFDIMFDFSTIETTCVHQSGCFSSLPGRLLKHWRTHWLEVMEKIALCRTGGNRLLKLKRPALVGWRPLTRFDSIWGRDLLLTWPISWRNAFWYWDWIRSRGELKKSHLGQVCRIKHEIQWYFSYGGEP